MIRTAPLAALAMALVTVAACSGARKATGPTVPATVSSTSTTAPTTPSVAAATPKATTPKAVAPKAAIPKAVKVKAGNPLTGLAVATGPVIAVKIDDTGPGRPQLNIDKADLVYVEEVEAGLTRLLAIYDSAKPVVGYVRSIRLADPELLLQYGKITLAASGGSVPSLRNLRSSGLPGWINDAHAAYFRRDRTRASSYINLTLDLAAVSRAVKTASARNVGFVWNAHPAGLASLPAAASISTKVGRQKVSFVFDAKTQRYVRTINGDRQRAVDGRFVSTPNVIVQECTVTASTHKDVNGQPQQLTRSIGRGVVHVFRSGREYSGTWTRKNASSPTLLRDAKGVPIPLAPGGGWIALVRPHTPITR